MKDKNEITRIIEQINILVDRYHTIHFELKSSKNRTIKLKELNTIIENIHKYKDIFEKYFTNESKKYPEKMNNYICDYRKYLLSVIDHTAIVVDLQKYYLRNIFYQILSTIKIIKALNKLDYYTKICQINGEKVNLHSVK